MSLNETPRADRLHIGIYGKRNAGKSSLINALTGQDIALVSPEAGTTTDPVFKSMELHPVGPVVFIDTAGFDDEGELGALRVERTEAIMDKTDIAVLVVDGAALLNDEIALVHEKHWLQKMKERKIPVIIAVNKLDTFADGAIMENREFMAAASELFKEKAVDDLSDILNENLNRIILRMIYGGDKPLQNQQTANISVISISALKGYGLDRLRAAVERMIPEDFLRRKIVGNLIEERGLALLVMPQDIQAPKGRLILPQVQTLRELLDRHCTAISTTVDGLERTLAVLSHAPDLIITDSQCFAEVYERKPAESALTSFSVLFAACKGDIEKFVDGASSLDDITENSRVLIAEACTHVPLSEDIGREKIPQLLHKKFGEALEIVNVCGNDFPAQEELKKFDLIIHCGACMFNRKHVMNRIAAAEAAGVPITNYGVVLAKLSGILDKIALP